MLPDFDALYHAVSAFEDAGEEYERILRRVYEAVLRPGDTAADVGAHVGKHTLPLALACSPGGSVVAIEAIPWAHERLAARVSAAGLDDVVRVVHAACADAVGEATFSIVPSHPGWSSLAVRATVEDVEPVTVRRTTLDTELAAEAPVRFVKIDVEGAEQLVLRGASALIARHHPVIHVEVVPSALLAFETPLEELGSTLREQGYRVFDLLGHDVTDEAAWKQSSAAGGLSDYVAIQPDDEAYDRVRAVLASSFTAERLDRVRAPEGLDLPPLATNTHPVPGGRPMDGARPVPERLLRPVGGLPPTDWPAPAEGYTELVLGDPSSWWNVNQSSVRDAREHVTSTLPVSIGPSFPVRDRTLVLDLELTAFLPRGTQTLLELFFPDTGAKGLVRFTQDTVLQVLWLDDTGRILVSRSAKSAADGEHITLGLAGAGDRVVLDAECGTARVHAELAASALGSGLFVGAIGERRHHPNPERLLARRVAVAATATDVARHPSDRRSLARRALGRVRQASGRSGSR